MHEKLHKNVNPHFMQIFMYFYGEQLKQSYTANFLYIVCFFNPFKMAVQF